MRKTRYYFLTPEKEQQIVELLKTNLEGQEIAKQLGVSPSTVSKVKHKDKRKAFYNSNKCPITGFAK